MRSLILEIDECMKELYPIFVQDIAQWKNIGLEEIPEPVRNSEPKVGRNEPCPCGSGKKFKHCCLM
jgi:uncharacterized protein YecA (UPF0149 family)